MNIQKQLSDTNERYARAVDQYNNAEKALENAEAAHQLTIRQEAVGDVAPGASRLSRSTVDQAYDDLELARVRVEVLGEQIAELQAQETQARINDLRGQLDVICDRAKNTGVKIDALIEKLVTELYELENVNQEGFLIQADLRVLGSNAAFPGYRIVLGDPAYHLLKNISTKRGEQFLGGAKLI